MKITDAKVVVCCPGRNFVTLKIYTDSGLYGLGDATLNGRELAVASYLRDHVVPCLVGRDPFQTEDIWQYLYRGAYWRKGPVTMTAIAAVDVALWDIKAKALEHAALQPARRQGPRRRDGLRPRQRQHIDEDGRRRSPSIWMPGYKAVRAQCAIPGLPTTYGVAQRRRVPTSRRRRGCRPSTPGRREKYLRVRAQAVRASCARRSATTCTCCTTCITG